MAWHAETDSVELKLADIHFGKVIRGRVSPTTTVFKGDSKVMGMVMASSFLINTVWMLGLSDT